MAVDSAQKRASAFLRGYYIPTGGIDTALERQQVRYLYGADLSVSTVDGAESRYLTPRSLNRHLGSRALNRYLSKRTINRYLDGRTLNRYLLLRKLNQYLEDRRDG